MPSASSRSLRCFDSAATADAPRRVHCTPLRTPHFLALHTATARYAARRANIGWGRSGATSIDQYIDDDGKFNRPVGHRRWFLWPRLSQVGLGFADIPVRAASLFFYVFFSLRPALLWLLPLHSPPLSPPTHQYTSEYVPASCAVVLGGPTATRPQEPEVVAWPPHDAFVPTHLMPRSSRRWSYARHQADFSQATVTVFRGGELIDVTLEPLALGFGDNTLVFVVNDDAAYDLNREEDLSYIVVIDDIGNADVESHTYVVTVFNPFVTVDTTTSEPCPVQIDESACEEQCLLSGFLSEWSAETPTLCLSVRGGGNVWERGEWGRGSEREMKIVAAAAHKGRCTPCAPHFPSPTTLDMPLTYPPPPPASRSASAAASCP